MTAMKVLILGWLEYRENKALQPLTQDLHPRLELATQQVNAFFRGPVVSMAYARCLGPQIIRERPSAVKETVVDLKPLKEPTVTKNFARVSFPCSSSPMRKSPVQLLMYAAV
jgi:hypothetical protein